MGDDGGPDRADRGTVLALCEMLCPSMNGPAAHRLAQALSGGVEGDAAWFEEALDDLAPERLAHWQAQVEALAAAGVEVVTSRDERYPTNLSLVHDAPPALFVRGRLGPADRRSVAVVGSRRAGKLGRALAHRLAQALAQRDVTVISGLAYGIDTAAHSGAISAGGRTIAVYGTTIEQVYPSANRALARSIAERGACVSQFLPGRSTGPWAFPVQHHHVGALRRHDRG